MTQLKRDLTEWINDLGSEFDKISVSNLTISDTESSHTEKPYVKKQSCNTVDTIDNIDILFEIFSKYKKFDRNLDEEELIFEIIECEEVDWFEISIMSNLPEFIMDEFSNQLNWVIILLNRKMLKRTLNKFKRELFNATKTHNFVNKLSTIDNYVIINNILFINEELSTPIFVNACKNGNAHIVKLLLNNFKISNDNINVAFLYACEHNYDTMVEILVNDIRVTNKSFSIGFIDACKNGYVVIVRTLVNDSRNTPQIFNAGLVAACAKKHLLVVGFLARNFKITPSTFKSLFNKACSNGQVNIIQPLADNPSLTINIMNSGYTHAMQNGFQPAIELLNKIKVSKFGSLTNNVEVPISERDQKIEVL